MQQKGSFHSQWRHAAKQIIKSSITTRYAMWLFVKILWPHVAFTALSSIQCMKFQAWQPVKLSINQHKLRKTTLWTILQCASKKQYTWLVNKTLVNVDRFSKFFHYQIPKESLYGLLQGLPPHFSCVATLPCEIQKRLNFDSYHRN